MNQGDFEEILRRYRAGQATPEEEKVIDAWYEAMGKQINALMSNRPEEGLEEHYWNSILQQIKITEASKQGLPGEGKRSTRKMVKYIAGIAASLLVAALTCFYLLVKPPVQKQFIGGSSVGNESPMTWKIVENIEKNAQVISLPDGSKITLEPQSRIKFLPAFTATKREVYLEGEGFFEVTHNERQPFIVYAKNVTTKVLGTSFTIKAYSADKKVMVAVSTGRVSVSTPTDTVYGKSPLILTPNQKIVYDNDAKRTVKQIVEMPKLLLAPEEVKRMHFEDAPLTDIFKAIEKMYGVEIDFDKEVFSSCTLTTSLSGGGLYNRLDIICSAIGAKYAISENRIIVTGKGCTTRVSAP